MNFSIINKNLIDFTEKKEDKPYIVDASIGISERRIQTICNEGMVPGVIKFGHAWAIPKDAVKPVDKRIKSGKYSLKFKVYFRDADSSKPVSVTCPVVVK